MVGIFFSVVRRTTRLYPFNPKASVAQKSVDEVVFRRFQGEGVEFFKIGPHGPPSDFWCASFGNYRFKPFQISFLSGFYIKIMFWLRWFYSLFERMRLKRNKRCLFTLTFNHIILYKKIPIFLREGKVRVGKFSKNFPRSNLFIYCIWYTSKIQKIRDFWPFQGYW